MLYLTRKVGQSVIINDDIEVTVVDIRGKSIKLGFTFPPDASVLRREIYDRVQEENQAAAAGSETLAEALQGTVGKAPDLAPPTAGADPAGDGNGSEPAPADRPEADGDEPVR